MGEGITHSDPFLDRKPMYGIGNPIASRNFKEKTGEGMFFSAFTIK